MLQLLYDYFPSPLSKVPKMRDGKSPGSTKVSQPHPHKASEMERPVKEPTGKAGGSNMGPQTLALNTHKAGMEGSSIW